MKVAKGEVFDAVFGVPTWRERIAVASKTKHAAMWRRLRDEGGWPICSTWIDEAGPGETRCFGELAARCVHECSTCTGLIVFVLEGETLKGALSEMGIAITADKRVAVVNADGVDLANYMGIMYRHPNVREFCGLIEARRWLKRR